MAKGFTPIIGLAVVVALAVVAVFGAMSLTNPAFAAIGQPADAELTERTFSPQVTTLEVDVYVGEDFTYDLIPRLGGREDDVTKVEVSAPTPTGVATFAEAPGRRDVGVVITPADDATDGSTTTVRVTITFNDSEMMVFLEVTIKDITPAETSDETQGTVTIPVAGEGGDIGKPTFLKVDQLFVDGKGVSTEDPAEDGKITAYTPSSSNVGDVVVGHVTVISGDHDDDGDTADAAIFSITTANGVTFSGSALEGYLDAMYVVGADPGPEVTASEGRRSTEIDKLIDIKIDDFDEGERTGYIVLYAPDGAEENDFSTVTVRGMDGLDTNENADPVIPDPRQSFLTIVGPATVAGEVTEIIKADRGDLPLFEPDSSSPGSATSYKVTFEAADAVNTRQSDLVIEFDGDYGMPATMRNTSVAITTEGGDYPRSSGMGSNVNSRTFTPEDVTVDGEKILISLGDMDEHDDRIDYDISAKEVISVLFRQSAGISNPTEAKGYNLVAISFGDAADIEYNDATEDDLPGLDAKIIRKIGLSSGDGGLGDSVDATGKGFKNGTTLTVFLDKKVLVMWDDDNDDTTAMVNLGPGGKASTIPESYVTMYNDAYKDGMDADPARDRGNVPWIPTNDDGSVRNVDPDGYAWAPNGARDQDEEVLCMVAKIDGNDVGKCGFDVTHPTFGGGFNYVNARDGRGNYAPEPDEFELTASINATPDTGSPGERILVQVVDFPANSQIIKAELARDSDRPVCAPCGTGVDGTGAGTFSFTIPNWLTAGTQELKVFGTNDVDASKNVTISGPQIQINPKTVLANQRVSLIGTGFSPGSVIANASDDLGLVPPVISIGGKPISSDRINDGDPVRVDNGGNWSASVDLPLAEATTAEGVRVLRVTDSRARTGDQEVTIPVRSVTITPKKGRVGTTAVVRGQNFPSKNDEGKSFNITIVYDASNGNTTTVSATPDASGRFEEQLRIPTTAAIPSSNTVKVSFLDEDGIEVPITVPHDVPEGIVESSETSGGPGSVITVHGEGFKSFVPISLVKIGTLDVTPAPKPSTDGNGMMSFPIVIPGLDTGIQTVEVNVGRTTSSTGFTVTESGVNPGDIKEVAVGLEPLGDNFVSIWHFNNDTKMWSFYTPALEEGNSLTHVITGETYLIRVKSTTEVILNNDTRSLTCVGDNCWNQLVW